MPIYYADSGRGWYCDSRYYKNHIGLLATINGRDYKKKEAGACICVTAYNSTSGNTGVIVISDVLNEATYSTMSGTAVPHSAFQYGGLTWYISTFSYWQIGQYGETSGKTMYVTISGSDYTAIGQYIMSLVSLQTESVFLRFLKKINYNGDSKVIRRLCQIVSNLDDRFMKIEVYDTNNNGVVDNSERVNNHTVETDVPTNALFTDTVYDDTEVRADIRQLQNNVLLLMNEIFHSEVDYLVDHQGNYIVDHEGNRIVVESHDSKFAAIVARLTALENKKYLVWGEGTNEEEV